MTTISAEPSQTIHHAFKAAIRAASAYLGATSPNPAVGAAALDIDGNVLSVQAHRRAGEGHAEANVFSDCVARGLIGRVHRLVVTLEPCNHQGRTPPCVQAILRHRVPEIWIGTPDPNPEVAGGGEATLRAAGVTVHRLDPASALAGECRELIAPFVTATTQKRPFIVVKRAFDAQGSMIPPTGQKTFTSAEALAFAHWLRRRSDAIITGSGTVLADHPEFTVRRVADLPNGRRFARWLIVLDRRGRVPDAWFARQRALGFQVRTDLELEAVPAFLRAQSVTEALVEAGPELSTAWLGSMPWDRDIRIESRRDVAATLGSPTTPNSMLWQTGEWAGVLSAFPPEQITETRR